MNTCPYYGATGQLIPQAPRFPQQMLTPSVSFVTNPNGSIQPICSLLPTAVPGQMPGQLAGATWNILNTPLHSMIPVPPERSSEGQVMSIQPSGAFIINPLNQERMQNGHLKTEQTQSRTGTPDGSDQVKSVPHMGAASNATTTPIPTPPLAPISAATTAVAAPAPAGVSAPVPTPISAITPVAAAAQDTASTPETSSKPQKVPMKKSSRGASDGSTSSAKSKATSEGGKKEHVKRPPRRIWSDAEHSAYLKFIRNVSTNGRIDERILATIPDRTLIQIKQYSYKYTIYRENGLDVVDDAFSRHPRAIADFSDYITDMLAEYVGQGKKPVDKQGIVLGLYDSISFQWYLYHTLTILVTSSTTSPASAAKVIPPMTQGIFTDVSMGMLDIIQKPVFRNSSLQVAELVSFLVRLRKHINDNQDHIAAYNEFIDFICILTDGVDFTRCKTKMTSDDLKSLFLLCEDPDASDKALEMALALSPSVYVSFQCSPHADPGALRVVANLESCHLHIPHIPPAVFIMLCSVVSQICHELNPRTYLYLTTAFQVYLQMLNGSVEEIIYEVYKYGALRCTKKSVSYQSAIILCIVSYLLCFSIIQYKHGQMRQSFKL